ncbi:phosphorylase [Natrinema sp. H-ect1]|uniref:phosphorylase family protein n=1 Tax=Natrinema sp. H-ect1 TaxID=3242700 RepID=UPI00359E9136
MSDRDLPTPRTPDPDTPVRPSALVLPAVADPPLTERRPWLERAEITDAVAVPGTDTLLYVAEDGVAVTTTGIGKSDAATTVTALLAAPGVDLSSAYVVSTGIAGGPPARTALGSVVVADAIVDWDRKHRWDRGDADASPAADDPADRLDLLAYRPRDYVHRLEPRLVERAQSVAASVDLRSADAVRASQPQYPDAPAAGPTVETGTSVCGDEFWHGRERAREVAWLCEAYGVAPFLATQMEDAATATALERFDRLERYLSVRAVANYDRPAPGQSAAESFDGTDASRELAIDNAARAAGAVVDDLVAADPLGLDG